jgi:hypothetical protein
LTARVASQQQQTFHECLEVEEHGVVSTVNDGRHNGRSVAPHSLFPAIEGKDPTINIVRFVNTVSKPQPKFVQTSALPMQFVERITVVCNWHHVSTVLGTYIPLA